MSTQALYELERVDTESSIDSLATAPNLPGPGRNVGLLFDHLGARLETAMNRVAARNTNPSLFSRHRRDNDETALVRWNSSNDINLNLTRTDSHSSIDSNATAANLVGPGRTLGLVLDFFGARFEGVLNRRASQLGLGPDAVANAIRVLCQHHATSISERHAALVPSLGKSETKALKKMCKKLIKHTRSHILGNQLRALDELVELAIEDPLIRATLAGCNLERLMPKYRDPDLISSTSKAFGSIEFANVHCTWSDVITLRLDGAYSDDQMESAMVKLQYSLRDPNTSFLAARYFSRALKVFLFTMDESDLTARIWKTYLTVAAEYPDAVEWSNIDGCIQQDGLTYASPLHLLPLLEIRGLALHIVREARHLPTLLSKYFPTPKIEYRTNAVNDVSGDEFTFTRARGWKLDANSRFVFHFARALSGSGDIGAQVSFITDTGLDDETKKYLQGTVLGDKLFLTYSLLAYHAWQTRNNPVGGAWRKLVSGCAILLASLTSEYSDRRALASFLLARFSGIDRYCKLAVHYGAKRHPASRPKPVAFSPSLIANVRRMVGFREKVLLMWELPPTLYRFQVDGDYYIAKVTQRGSTGNFREILMKRHPHPRDVTVDVMDLMDRSILCITVDGTDRPFEATGHYPILAGYRKSSADEIAPLFVAQVMSPGLNDSQCFASLVTDGASCVPFINDTGVTQESPIFGVLVLRNDPVDEHPADDQPDIEKKDPTGPLFWRQVNPEDPKDRGYVQYTFGGGNVGLCFLQWTFPQPGLVEFCNPC